MITRKRLKEILRYDENNGEFYWRFWKPGVRCDLLAGGLDKKGYVIIVIDGKHYKAHRLVWLYKTGEWPVDQIDHRDLNKSNNKWDNIRQSGNEGNSYNRTIQTNNTSGCRGVGKFKNKWRAVIKLQGVTTHIGLFDTIEEASLAYNKIAKEEFGKFYRDTRM